MNLLYTINKIYNILYGTLDGHLKYTIYRNLKIIFKYL